MLDAGDLLEGLVALPEEEDDVAGPGETRRAADRVAPVELDAHTRPLRAGDAAEHRVVDDPEHRTGGDALHPAARAREVRDRRDHALEILAEQHRCRHRRGEVPGVVLAEERSPDAMRPDPDGHASLVQVLERPREER